MVSAYANAVLVYYKKVRNLEDSLRYASFLEQYQGTEQIAIELKDVLMQIDQLSEDGSSGGRD